MNKLLALDQASYTTGYAIFEDDKLIEINHFDCVGDELGERLQQFRCNIDNLIDQHNITEVAFEDVQLQENKGGKEVGIKTYKMLSEVYGVLEELLVEKDVSYTIIPPIVWKATFKIAGKGRKQEKALAQAEVLRRYGLQCSEDEADAACLGTHYIIKKNSEFDWS